MEEQKDTITLEELIERERAKLGSTLTRVTLDTFLAWKARKRAEKIKQDKAANEKKKSDFSKGKMFGVSGRDLFTFNPDLVAGDDDEADDTAYIREDDDDEIEGADAQQYKEIDLADFAYSTSRVAAPSIAADISVDTGERFADINYLLKSKGAATAVSLEAQEEENKLNMAAAAPDPAAESDAAIAAAMAATVDEAGPIDENLFDDDDLEGLDDELEQLEL
ncbi:ZC3H15 [Bugula neritina]|uniref:ZC3H15 n=1 Tax=Bugula neritina TaxID=10212 RepID=A0A7J7KFF9_BUGNE|nr:ZC3H15 [Bugula neritina]